MKLTQLKEIAKLAVNIGINLQQGQEVWVYSSVNQAKFCEILTKECYDNVASKVIVEFHDEKIERMKYQYQNLKTLLDIRLSEKNKMKERSEVLPCLIYIDDDDPNLFDGLDTSKIDKSNQKKRKVFKKYRDQESMKNQWLIISLPSKSWAKQVFPNEKPNVAFKKLEDAILLTMRVKEGEDTISKWKEHISLLKKRADYLNSLNLDYLRYQSANGTDLILHLQEGHQWLSAESFNLKGVAFTANIPTEEVFTMPKKEGVDGIVYAVKPLSLNGKIIKDFTLRFEKGRIVEVHAKENEDTLKKAIDTDEGSHYLGEVALVPFSSPINQTNILFFNTLFDENACCHLAFGQAFEDNFKDYEKMTREEMIKKGFNDSLIHVDFMIGSRDLKITGYDFDGKEYPIFVNGDYAF